MKEFRNKVAVVTGAASGMGKAMTERFVAEGMKVVLVDVENEALSAAEREFLGRGSTVLAVRTDVSKAADVERDSQRARSRRSAPFTSYATTPGSAPAGSRGSKASPIGNGHSG